jgi:hypothetical protein
MRVSPCGEWHGPARAVLVDGVGRIGSGFFTLMWETQLVDRNITECQIRLCENFRQTETPSIATAEAGFSTAKAPQLPSQEGPRGRRRRDPLASVWTTMWYPCRKERRALHPFTNFAHR